MLSSSPIRPKSHGPRSHRQRPRDLEKLVYRREKQKEVVMTKLTPTLTRNRLLPALPERRRGKIIQLPRRRTHRRHLGATFWSTLTRPWRACTAPTLVDVSAKPLWTRDVISQRRPFLLTHVKQLAAIIAALAFLFGLWIGVSTYHTPRPSYPYYDTQKPVPPWSEPMPLEGNRDKGGE